MSASKSCGTHDPAGFASLLTPPVLQRLPARWYRLFSAAASLPGLAVCAETVGSLVSPVSAAAGLPGLAVCAETVGSLVSPVSAAAGLSGLSVCVETVAV